MAVSILARKRRKKRRMRYAEALKAMKAYQNNALKLENVVDRVLTPGRSKGDGRCQIESCHQHIRWEYHLRSKTTGDLIIVGSTCVWVLLEMSKEQIKEFERIERTIKDFHKMIEWRRDNLEVWEKIREARKRRIMTLEPFWEEIQYCALCQEDTDYIRNLDLDNEEKKWKKMQEEAEKKKAQGKPVKVNTELPPDGYDKVLAALNRLLGRYPDNYFFNSLKEYSEKKILTPKQIRAIKINTNKLYYEDVVKNNPSLLETYNNCDSVIHSRFVKEVNEKNIKIYSEDLKHLNVNNGVADLVSKYRRQFHLILRNDLDWKMYRVKHNILVSVS